LSAQYPIADKFIDALDSHHFLISTVSASNGWPPMFCSICVAGVSQTNVPGLVFRGLRLAGRVFDVKILSGEEDGHVIRGVGM